MIWTHQKNINLKYKKIYFFLKILLKSTIWLMTCHVLFSASSSFAFWSSRLSSVFGLGWTNWGSIILYQPQHFKPLFFFFHPFYLFISIQGLHIPPLYWFNDEVHLSSTYINDLNVVAGSKATRKQQ